MPNADQTPQPPRTPRTSEGPATSGSAGVARFAFLAILATLAGLTILALVLVIGELSRGAKTAVAPRAPAASSSTSGTAAKPTDAALASVVPSTPWLRPPSGARLTRIGIGSCLDQLKPQPIWKAIKAARPELFLLIGDNVYAKDVKTPDAASLIEAYATQAAHPELKDARATIPFLATWDDHDYGLNDGGADFIAKARAAEVFRAFWQQPEAAQADGGIYYSRTFGAEGQRVQVIMLDTRSFRSALKLRDDTFPHWGKYQPDATPSKTMLGAQQWRWLEAELKKPAEIRLIASSIQVLADGHGFERWGNLPAERQKLVEIIRDTGAAGVVLLSGDRHIGARYEETVTRKDGTRQILVELTSSSLNRPYGPSKDGRLPPLVSDLYHPENFGMIGIDWQARTVSLNLHDLDGKPVQTRTLTFDELSVKN